MSGAAPVLAIRRRAYRRPLRRLCSAAALLLAACGSGGPPPVIYVLGGSAERDFKAEPLLGRPVLEVRPVLMPDYLDGSDILVRRADNAMQPSETGRWAERLSVGTTRALAADLTRRLPALVVTIRTPAEPPTCQLFVDVEAFEADIDKPVVLTAQWRITDGTAQRTLAGEHVSVSEPVVGAGDAKIVGAMTRAVDDLADHIVAGVHQAAGHCGVSRQASAAVVR